MTFISYAQNYEDVMLNRCFEHINDGFYIDVGAAWPDLDSVTKAFYLKGWRGINIEPNNYLISQLDKERTRDINLGCALSDKTETVDFSFFDNKGLSTAVDKFAAKHKKNGVACVVEEIACHTLGEIWQKHVPKNQVVHFVKIDVEGFEQKVIAGNDWHKNRAQVIVVESTEPMSSLENFKSWEPLLLDANYLFAYADGLNRFYVASEKKELLDNLKYPPNVLDDFKKKSLLDLELNDAKFKLIISDLTNQLEVIENSCSWRLTAPLRRLIAFFRTA